MINLEKIDCCGCQSCKNICPKKAINMIVDEKGFKYPFIDKNKCMDCGLCEKACPVLHESNFTNKINAYACINNNEKIRISSSSGGVFYLIASYIISNDGVVFGVQLNERFEVEHCMVNNKKDLEKLMGSKYVQSDIKNTYTEAKNILNSGKKVLFTGTPCQIEGLKCFLKKDYDNLFTQDIICHGVPSPLVWKKYKEYRKNQDKEIPVKINFRNKDNGWTKFNLKFYYNNSFYKKNQNKDLFMCAFLKNTILRDSCYNCKFKKKNRISDITLADYWGVKNDYPQMFDNKGTSLVIINSDKGRSIFENIKKDLKFLEIDLDSALKYNRSMIESVKPDINREQFFCHLNDMNFDKLVKKFTYKKTLFKKIWCKCKNAKKIIDKL